MLWVVIAKKCKRALMTYKTQFVFLILYYYIIVSINDSNVITLIWITMASTL